MGQKKGHSGNYSGRPKGTPNHITKTLRQRLQIVLEAEIDNLPALLTDIEPEKRARIITDLLQYVIPKATGEEVEVKPQNNSFVSLVKEQHLNTMLNKLQVGNQNETSEPFGDNPGTLDVPENFNSFDNNKLRETS
jgi:hypothetical protein